MINLKKTCQYFSLLALLTSAASGSYAQTSSKFALGPKIGTQGVGIEARTPIVEGLYVRPGANYFKMKRNFGSGALEYKSKLTLFTVPLMLDYHPISGSGFRVSAGIAYNSNKVTATATPTATLKILGTTYRKVDLGTINAKLKLGSKIGGLVTVGYDNSLMNQSPWSFNAEAGIMYCGKPKLELSVTGLAGQQQADVDRIRQDADKKLKKAKRYLRIFPVVSLGFKYSF